MKKEAKKKNKVTSTKDENIEVLSPPLTEDQIKEDPSILLQHLTQYSERPDLLIDAIEKHDPGFIKKVNQMALNDEKESSKKRFKFGEIQAYSSLGIQFIAVFGCIATLVILALNGKLGFFNTIGLGIFYAISQGGRIGFMKIIDQIVNMVKGKKDN